MLTEKEIDERIEYAKDKLREAGVSFKFSNPKKITFLHKGAPVSFWPLSGWHSGETIESGRGIKVLLGKIKV